MAITGFLFYLQLLLAIVCFYTSTQVTSGVDPCARLVNIDVDLAEAITYEHNFYRSMVNPPATNMRRMVCHRSSTLQLNMQCVLDS